MGGVQMGYTQEPLGYLLDCSKGSLESFELSRLNQASNLRKEFYKLLDDWVNAEVSSRVAHWIAERSGANAKFHVAVRPRKTNLACAVQLDLGFLPDQNRVVWESRRPPNSTPAPVMTL